MSTPACTRGHRLKQGEGRGQNQQPQEEGEAP